MDIYSVLLLVLVVLCGQAFSFDFEVEKKKKPLRPRETMVLAGLEEPVFSAYGGCDVSVQSSKNLELINCYPILP